MMIFCGGYMDFFDGVLGGKGHKAYHKLEGEGEVSKKTRFHKFNKKTDVKFREPVKETKHDETNYLDDYRLLKGARGDAKIKDAHRNWYLNAALFLSQAENESQLEDKKRYELVALHGYSKAATVGEKNADNLGIQVSPFLHEDDRYYRSSRNSLLNQVNAALAEKLGLNDGEVQLVQSPLLNEIFARENPQPGLDLKIRSKEDYANLIDTLLNNASKGITSSDSRVIVDITALMKKEKVSPQNLNALIKELEDILISKLDKAAQTHNHIDKEQLIQVFQKFHLIAYKKLNSGHYALLTPQFLMDPDPRFGDENNKLIRDKFMARQGNFIRDINDTMIHSGYRIAPDEAKKAWLAVKDAVDILSEQNMPIAQLATGSDHVPILFQDMKTFLNQPVVQKFHNLSEDSEKNKSPAPYLKILPEATVRLLEGLEKMDIDKGFARSPELLQISFFRILDAMNEAIFRKDDQMAFQNQIELIHQEIQNILLIMSPYKHDDYAEAVIQRLTNRADPVVPAEMTHVYLKPSAMHTLASVLSGVEKLKGSNDLKVAVLKDTYYESSDALHNAKSYSLTVLDGDKFNELIHNEDKTVKSGKGKEKEKDRSIPISSAFETTPAGPFDVFVCEMHHNISLTRQTYSVEKIAQQVKMMNKAGLLANKFTLVIDSTIDVEKSSDIKALLNDPDIKKMIENKKLNVVITRSAQKFDMLGIDNYYGGVAITVNNPKAFKAFNQRMNHKDDQLEGLNYQGLAHLESQCGDLIDQYKTEIMQNTQRLYKLLPKHTIYSENNENPIQVSKIKDKKVVFLDIKFGDYNKTCAEFKKQFLLFAEEEKLPFTTRASFGFSNTNFTVISGHKFRLNPGLDSAETLDRYAGFFHSFQECIDLSLQEIEENKNTLREQAEQKTLNDLKKWAINKVKSENYKELKEAYEKDHGIGGDQGAQEKFETYINSLIEDRAEALVQESVQNKTKFNNLVKKNYGEITDSIMAKKLKLLKVAPSNSQQT